MTAFFLFTLIALKIPVCLALWILWRAWSDTPEQVIGDATDGGGGSYRPGPRTRGPHDGSGPSGRAVKRADSAHPDQRSTPGRIQRIRV